MLHRFVTAVFTVAILTGLFTSVALAQDPDNGKVIWEEQSSCQRCHGAAAEGMWAGPVAGTERTIDEFTQQVRAPRRNMPAYTVEQISDEQLADVHAYLTTLTRPADFAPIDAGLPADAPVGQQLIVEKRCAACHSTEGPFNGFVERGETPTVEAIAMQVYTPRRNMPAYTTDQVSQEEIAQITDFLVQQVSAQMPADDAAMAEEAAPAAEAEAAPADEAPATLPATGSSLPFDGPAALLIIGGLILVAGYSLRRLTA
jgi:mono/diheme cytochrome c family protein